MERRVLDTFFKLSRPIPGRQSAMVVMGLDVSLSNTGVSVIHAGRVRTFAIGKGTEVSSLERLAFYQEEITNLLNRYQPDVVMIEGYSFGSKFSRPHSIGELGGVLKLAIRAWAKARMLSPKVYIVPPTTLKKAVLSIGKGDKKAVKAGMLTITGMTFPDDDQCDATALALSGLVVAGVPGTVLPDPEALLPNKKGSSPIEKLL